MKSKKLSFKEYCNAFITRNKDAAANNYTFEEYQTQVLKDIKNIRNKGVKCIEQKEQEIKYLKVMLFTFIRNAAVIPLLQVAKKQDKDLVVSEQEITDKVFETIELGKKEVNFTKAMELMNLASKKENRYNYEEE